MPAERCEESERGGVRCCSEESGGITIIAMADIFRSHPTRSSISIKVFQRGEGNVSCSLWLGGGLEWLGHLIGPPREEMEGGEEDKKRVRVWVHFQERL
jgi:hypothetical protein